MIPKQLADVSLVDVEALAANAVPEGRTLEFKAQLPGGKDDDKREFLYDVISLANTDGGDLIFGVEEKAGVAKAVPGAALTDTLDATLLRLENLLSTSVEPRIPGVRLHPIEVATNVAVIVMRIPASFAAPHRAGIGGTRKFYHRNSRGKAEMDVHELRAAFTASEGLVPRITALHEQSVRAVEDREFPFQLAAGPRAVLSFIPLSVLREPRELDLDQTTAFMPPISGGDWTHSLEGFYIFNPTRLSGARAFGLTRRTGQIDVSWTLSEIGANAVRVDFAEATIKVCANRATAVLGSFGIEGPFAVALTVLYAKGYRLEYEGYYSPDDGPGMWRDKATLPIVTVDSLDANALTPLARSLWYAMGEKRPALFGALGTDLAR